MDDMDTPWKVIFVLNLVTAVMLVPIAYGMWSSMGRIATLELNAKTTQQKLEILQYTLQQQQLLLQYKP